MDQWHELVGAELAGFRLAEVIGVGGQAAVFLGINDARPGQRRAIKVVAPHLAHDPTFEQRFLEEAEVLERLTHPNIVAFRDVRIAPAMRGRESIRGGARFMALELELLEGQSLREVSDTGRGLDPCEVLEWMAQAADGLAAAHALQIIHRDIKPGNLFLCNDGAVKVIDFGIARAISRADVESAGRLTKTGHTAGTTLFIAPELWARSEATPAVDIYALGLTLAQMVLGRHPFFRIGGKAPHTAAIMTGHLQDDLRGHLRTAAGPLPRALQDIILRLCQREPAGRPSAQDAAQELRQAVDALEHERAEQVVASQAITGVQSLFAGVRNAVERHSAATDSQSAAALPAVATPPAVNTRKIAAESRMGPSRESRPRNFVIAAVSGGVIVLTGVAALVGLTLRSSPAQDTGQPPDPSTALASSPNLSGTAIADPSGPTPPVIPTAPVELRIRTDIDNGHLFVDREDYGPVTAGADVELELPPGEHQLEIRVAGVSVVASAQTLRPGVPGDVLLLRP